MTSHIRSALWTLLCLHFLSFLVTGSQLSQRFAVRNSVLQKPKQMPDSQLFGGKIQICCMLRLGLVETIYKSVSSTRPPLLENLPLNTGRLFITTCIHHSYLLLSLKLRPQRIAYQLRYSNPILQSTSPHFTIITKNIQKVSLLSKQQKLLRLQQKNPSQKVSSSPTSYLTDITKMAGRKKM